MKEKVKRYLFPVLEDEVQRYVDEENIHNICLLSFWAMVFELFSFLLFVVTRKQFDSRVYSNMGSVLYCSLVCGAAFLCSRWMIKNDRYEKQDVQDFKITYFLLLTTWAIWVSYQNYIQGGQLLTFFAVELMMVCFVTFRPMISIVLSGCVYAVLYAVLYSIDGAQSFHFLNYLVLALVSTGGMLVGFHYDMRTGENAVQLRRSNELLTYSSRHDGLTGLGNRMALDEDAASFLGKQSTVFMIDIDYFKEINDIYGHVLGDAVLRETGEKLRQLFPDERCYRYGGDEFLVICAAGTGFDREILKFTTEAIPEREIALSFGRATGTPQDHEQLFALINEADAGLYEIKRKIHSPEYGGRDRRRARP